MLVLVTGATGRIGAHLVRALLRDGHTVRALVVPGDPRADGLADRQVEIVRGQLDDTAALAAAVREVDAVCHLAGALTSRGASDEECFAVNLRGTFGLLVATWEHAPRLRRFLYASSDAVYWSGLDAGALALPVDEGHPRLAGTVYGASKIGAEELCLTFWRGHGLPVVILRFGATADAGELVDPRSVFARWIFLRAGIAHLAGLARPTPAQAQALATLRELDTGPEQLFVAADREGRPEVRQWADARDIAEGCLRALTVPAAIGEVFNVGGAAPHAADELARHVAARLDLPIVTARLPTARAPWYISSEKARGMLGYAPRRTVFTMVDEALGGG